MTKQAEDFLLNLAAEFTAALITNVSARLRNVAFGDAELQALNRAYNYAFSAMLRQIALQLDDEMTDHVKSLIRDFVNDEEVSDLFIDIALEGREPPLAQLHARFEKLEFDAQTLPVNFDEAMADFVNGLEKGLQQEAAKPGNPLYNQVSLGRLVTLKNLLLENQRVIERLSVKPTPQPIHDEQKIIQSYCRQVQQCFSTIHLFGEHRPDLSNVPDTIERMTDIDRSFVPLYLIDWQEEGEAQETEPLDIEALFFNSVSQRRFLLRGLPGSGKTTLLRYLTHRFAGLGLAGEKECIPVYLRLKNLDLHKASLAEFVREQINLNCESDADCDTVLCKSGRFLDRAMVLLFDGVDEIEDTESNQKIAEALDELARKHPHCKIIVSSRPLGLRYRHYSKYRALDILPLNPALIDDYLQKWFAGNVDKISQLWQTFENKLRIRALAANPFLLSMICYTYEQAGDAALIERRSELYKNCTRALLRRAYDPESTAEAKMNYENTLAILKDLSLRFFLWQEADFPVEHVNVIGKRILTADVLGKTAVFLDHVQRETGLLQRDKEGFTFVHRSLWEYFTALALFDKTADFVIRHAANPDWEEVVRLYAGLLPTREKVAELIDGLWKINRPLALRVTTEVQTPPVELLKPLIAKEESNQSKLLLIDALTQSLPLIPESERKALVQETLDILLIKCEERDCEVIYHAQEFLEKIGLQPLQPGGLIYELFDLEHATERQQQFLADPANHFEWIEVEGGVFWMGDDEHDDDEKPAHHVKVDSFRMVKHPMTNRLLSKFPLGEKNINEKENLPATNVTWWEAYYFSLWIDARLPTEAEWEYAARGGIYAQRTQYYFGDSEHELSNHAWYNETHGFFIHAVDEVNPCTSRENLNPLGLANILGNVWEWCEDWFAMYPTPKNKDEIAENPRGPRTGKEKILRGGSSRNPSGALRCASRNYDLPLNRYYAFGFRVVCGTRHF